MKKKLKYSPDYTEKMRKLKKYLEFQFGGEVRKKVLNEIGARVRSLPEHEQVGISVREIIQNFSNQKLCIRMMTAFLSHIAYFIDIPWYLSRT